MQLISSLGVGGAERLLVDYIAETTGSPRPQVVVVMNGGESPAFRREIEATGRPVHFLGRRRGAPTPLVLGTILTLIARHRVGVVHSHNGGSKTWSYLAKAARPSLKLAHTVHNTGVVIGYSRLQLALHRRLIAGTIAISHAVGAECEAVRLGETTVIENGVALHRFAPSPPRTLTGPLRLVCVGRLTRQKGQDILADALAICVAAELDFDCRLIGDAGVGDEDYAARLRTRIARPDLAGRVTIEGGRTDIPDILRMVDLFLMPSRFEGFGLALVEAMASGVPVIAADVDGPGRILRDHPQAGALTPPEDPQALAETILALAADEPRRRRMGAAGPIAACSYGIARMAERYERFYAAL